MSDYTKANTKYIQSLRYNLDELLAVNLGPSIVQKKDEMPRERKGKTVILITKIPHDTSNVLTENSLLDPTAGVIYPGAILKQNSELAEGIPTPYALARGPLKLRVILPGLGEKGIVTIEHPTNTTVQVEIDKIVDYWLDNIKGEGYAAPLQAQSQITRSCTQEQIGIDLGFAGQWGKNKATADLEVDSSKKIAIFYQAFRQIYYTVEIEEPGEPGTVFASHVMLSGVNMPATEPPGFVRTVSYGRIIIVKMMTSAQVTEQEASATIEYKTAAKTNLSAELKEKYKMIANNSSFQAFVLGGGTGGAGELLGGDVSKLKDVIARGIEFTKSNPAYPIAYIVADLKSRETSKMTTSTRWIETIREEVKDHSITLQQDGWYLTRFTITWLEPDPENPEKCVQKSLPLGMHQWTWKKIVWLPGDASDIMVTAKSKQGQNELSHHFDALNGDKKLVFAGNTLRIAIDRDHSIL